MNRLLFSLFCLLTGLTVSSQKVYFIYFQSETQQPFYIKAGEKIHSSTALGYLILSKLRDSTYTLRLGFPGHNGPEQEFTVPVAKKDHGYLLKNFGEKGWGLFDLQTLAVMMPVSGTAAVQVKKEEKDVSDFTEVLSKAAGDPSLKEKPAPAKAEELQPPAIKKEEPAKEEKVKPVPVQPEVKKPEPVAEPVLKKENADKPVQNITAKAPEPVSQADTLDAVKEEVKTVPVEKETVTAEKKTEHPAIAEYKRSVVTRRSESSTTEGFGLVFTDDSGAGSVDTIRLTIPNPKQALVMTEKKEEPKEEKKFLDMPPADTVKKTGEVIPATEVVKAPVAEAQPAAEKKPAENKNCAGVADENDFFELRKRMAAETSDDNMITEAKKYFKTKCFSTLQVKNLSLLFLNEEGKYHFFDAAYPFAADPERFASLEGELKDAYFINRFRAMLR